MGKSLNPYLSINATIVAAQNRVAEFETTTEGYTLLDMGMGCEIPCGSHKITIDLAVENLFNKAYRDHLSRYKAYALNPGRTIVLKVSVPFTLVE